MMARRLLLPLLLALAGLLAGLGAGWALRPDAAGTASEEPQDGARDGAPESAAGAAEPAGVGATEFVNLENQFIVPVLREGRVVSLVVLSLGLELGEGERKLVFAREPRIRDSLLQVMFDHANAGGFEGPFTEGSRLALLRKALLEAARAILGPVVRDVLIVEIARQDG